jgi:hypothetical protein
MVKTSLTDYVVGGIMASCVIAVFVGFYVYAGFNYDISDINTSGLNSYGNFSEMVQKANESSVGVYDINADSGLFDVIGGLMVKGLSAIKSFISGISFVTKNIWFMLGNGMFHIPSPIIMAVISIITLLIAGVFLFRILSNKEDEKQ